MTSLSRRLAVLAVSSLLVLSACSDDGSSGDGGGGADPDLVRRVEEETELSSEQAECVVDALAGVFEDDELSGVIGDGDNGDTGSPDPENLTEAQRAALARAAECTAVTDPNLEIDPEETIIPQEGDGGGED